MKSRETTIRVKQVRSKRNKVNKKTQENIESLKEIVLIKLKKKSLNYLEIKIPVYTSKYKRKQPEKKDIEVYEIIKKVPKHVNFFVGEEG